jgi:uncharacterized protein
MIAAEDGRLGRAHASISRERASPAAWHIACSGHHHTSPAPRGVNGTRILSSAALFGVFVMSDITRDRMVSAEDGIRHEGAPAALRAPAATPSLARKHLGELYKKVDAVFARARARYRNQMACGSGCDDCCRQEFSVTAVEAALMRDALAALTPEVQRALAARAAEEPAGARGCPARDGRGGCAIYAARPLGCRTRGMPIRLGPVPGVRSLPVLEVCDRNFVGYDLAAVDAASVVDQRTLSAVLDAINGTYAEETGRPHGERVETSALLAG